MRTGIVLLTLALAVPLPARAQVRLENVLAELGGSEGRIAARHGTWLVVSYRDTIIDFEAMAAAAISTDEGAYLLARCVYGRDGLRLAFGKAQDMTPPAVIEMRMDREQVFRDDWRLYRGVASRVFSRDSLISLFEERDSLSVRAFPDVRVHPFMAHGATAALEQVDCTGFADLVMGPPSLLNSRAIQNLLVREYPMDLRDRGIGGTVRLLIHVSSSGTVDSVDVAVSSGHPRLDAIAQRVAFRIEFRPATIGGHAVAGIMDIPMIFTAR